MKATREKTKSGKTIYRVAYRVTGRRVRKTFHTRQKAEEWAENNADIGEKEGSCFGQLWLQIENKERHELMDALAIMRQRRLTDPTANLVEATTEYVARRSAV